MKVLAFAATNHLKSINRTIVEYAARLIKDRVDPAADVEILDLNDYELPLYRQDREEQNGIPQAAKDFFAKLGAADLIVISLAEHNGSYNAAYKNLHDWASRIDQRIFQGKKGLLFSTSIGKRGGMGVMQAATHAFPHFGMDVRSSLSIPSYGENFSTSKQRLTNGDLEKKFFAAIDTLNQA